MRKISGWTKKIITMLLVLTLAISNLSLMSYANADDDIGEGTLVITMRLLNADGNAKESSEVFYAGIFEDEAFTTLSDKADRNLVELNLNGRSEAIEEVQITLEENETLTLYVTETDKSGKPAAEATSFPYDVTVEGSIAELSEESSYAEVIIINQEVGVETEAETTAAATEIQTEETETETGAETETEQESENTKETKSAKTGDDTPLELMFRFLAGSAGWVVLLVVFLKRRRGVQ